ncbi:MAG: hypothetical protein WHT08_04800 [Bryobacteraceae bacterium]|jgi:hypothetical protein
MESLQAIAAVGVLAVLAAAAWLAARGRLTASFLQSRSHGPAEVVQRLSLTAHHSLHVVRLSGETLLVITFPGGAVLRGSPAFGDVLAAAGTAWKGETR